MVPRHTIFLLLTIIVSICCITYLQAQAPDVPIPTPFAVTSEAPSESPSTEIATEAATTAAGEASTATATDADADATTVSGAVDESTVSGATDASTVSGATDSDASTVSGATDSDASTVSGATDSDASTVSGATDSDASTVSGATGVSDEASPTPSPPPATTPSSDECEKDAALAQKQKRDCRTSCSDTKKCKNTKATCQCDGACGKVCITPDIKCRKPSNIENGKVTTLEGLHFGNAAIYTCEPDYELVGPEERFCQGDSKWSDEEPFCTPEGTRCPELPEIENGIAVSSREDSEDFFLGDYVAYKCNEGYRQEGENDNIECVTNKPKTAEWTPLNMTCEPNPCNPLEQIANGTVGGENYTFGDNATYKCNPGYAMVGEGELNCQADGSWKGDVPVCELPDVTCPIPEDPENGVVQYDPELYGHVVYYKCDPGFRLNGTEYRECVNDGEWSGNDTTCKEIDCGQPDEPENGTIIFLSGTTWSKQVDYSCNEDTTTLGEASAECLEDETWSQPPPTCLSHCIVVEIDHGFLVTAGVSEYETYNMIPTGVKLPHNTSAQVACDKNYEMPSTGPTMQNHGDVECCNGTWAPSFECVPARCFCEDLQYDKIHERNFTLARDCIEPTAHEAEVALKCEPDFPEMVKPGILKCEIGEWKYPQDPDEICQKKSCHVKDIKLDNGVIYKDNQEWAGVTAMDPTEMTNHGTELKFECTEPGYELYVDQMPVNHPESNVNFTIRDCENGVWSGRMPVCRPARCLCSNLTANITEKGLETMECQELASSGDFIQMQCAANYSNPTGPLIAECRAGEWQPFDTMCLKTCSCEDLRANMSESLTAKCDGSIDSGSAVDLECSRGYVNLTGTPAANCSEGLWILTDTFCNATDEVSIDEGLMRDCIYTTTAVSTQVQAFYQGKFLVNNSPVSHLDNITLRCSNVQNLKFKGNRQLQCIDGKFNAPMPQCLGLLPNSPTSAPSLWLTTYPPDYPKVNEEGVVIIPRHSAISITCWYSQSKPDIQIDSDVKFKSQKEVTFNRLVGWTTAYDSIPDITTLNYSCGVPGKTPKEDYTQYLEIKVADTCRLNENRIQAFGLLVDPSTRRYLYTENDQVDLICGGLVERAFPYMVCMQGGRWDFGAETDCPQEESTTPTILTTT